MATPSETQPQITNAQLQDGLYSLFVYINEARRRLYDQDIIIENLKESEKQSREHCNQLTAENRQMTDELWRKSRELDAAKANEGLKGDATIQNQAQTQAQGIKDPQRQLIKAIALIKDLRSRLKTSEQERAKMTEESRIDKDLLLQAEQRCGDADALLITFGYQRDLEGNMKRAQRSCKQARHNYSE